MNLVVGANGLLGTEICRLLSLQEKTARGLVRKLFYKGKIGKLKEYGIQLVQGDLRNSRSIETSLKGIKKVICTASSIPLSYIREENDLQSVDIKGITKLIDLSVEAGIQHFIYVSFSRNIDLDFPLRNAKRTIEQHLRNSGLKFTILRPSFFYETWLSPFAEFDVQRPRVKIYGTGVEPVSFISYFDVAQYAVESLRNPIAENAILELGGNKSLTQLEVLDIFRRMSETYIKEELISIDELQDQFLLTEDPMLKTLFGLRLCLAKGDNIDAEHMHKAFHLNLLSVEDFARKVIPASHN